jgi:hypothetical protein
MTELDISLPLRIRRLNDECIVVEDAAGTRLSCTHFSTDETRRRSRGSMAPDQAVAIAPGDRALNHGAC